MTPLDPQGDGGHELEGEDRAVDQTDTVPAASPASPGAHTGSGTGSGTGSDTRAQAPAASGLAVLGAAVKELAIVIGLALVLSFVVKTWLLQAFYIPSGSMEDTLRIDDRVIVSKLTPGPIPLRRGDIVVFADPGDWVAAPVATPESPLSKAVRDGLTFVGLLPDTSENHLIKRVIGLPGDHVVCCDVGGRITINGVPVKEPYLKAGNAASEQNFNIHVPAGRVWVMGDHRADSSDSRFHDGPKQNGSAGSVPESLIVGRAVALVWPLDHMRWLSNPTSTFAKVPPASHPAAAPAGPSGSGRGGGAPGQPAYSVLPALPERSRAGGD